jgi:DNA polymerase-1
LLKAKNESLSKDFSITPRKVHTSPTFNQAISYIKHAYELGLQGNVIDTDIEVINGELDCFAIAISPFETMSIPLRCQQGNYFTEHEEYEILKHYNAIISHPSIPKRGANFIFDTQFLFHKYGMIPRGPLHCTQIAQKIAFPDYPAGLDFVTSMHTDIPYYKADGKQWMKLGTGSWEEWWNYNGMDTISTAASHPKQVEALKHQMNIETYERQRKLIKPLIYMSERGIKVNVQGMITYKNTEQSKLDQLSTELNEVVGYPLNYNSPKQLSKYFYEDLKIKPYKNRKTGGISTDVNALKRLARQGVKAARIMLDIRSLSKRISTYLNIGKVDVDGRYRSSYKPVGAETGRLSSGETIFGTGGNQQNWPHDLLRFFEFDPGYIGYAYDLSQIENRIVAYVGGVHSIIKAFESGVDLHKLTASIIFNKPYDEISSEDGSSSVGDGRQSERYWGKKGNHAINYDVSYKTFALVNEMPENEAKMIIEKIHRGYPQIKEGYHVLIQNMLKRDRMVVNLFGRRRLFLGPIFPSPPNIPLHACQDTFRQAYAHLPQSTCADKINEQGIEYIYYNQHLFKPVELLAQIHDSIVFQIPESLPLIEHARILLLIKQSLETPLIWHDNEIQTPADLSIGYNMCKEDMAELKSKSIPSNPEDLADKLNELWTDLMYEKQGYCKGVI